MGRAAVTVSRSDCKGWRFELMGLTDINLSISMTPLACEDLQLGKRWASGRSIRMCAERAVGLSGDLDAELLSGSSTWPQERDSRTTALLETCIPNIQLPQGIRGGWWRLRSEIVAGCYIVIRKVLSSGAQSQDA
jgi:hypothetical protein